MSVARFVKLALYSVDNTFFRYLFYPQKSSCNRYAVGVRLNRGERKTERGRSGNAESGHSRHKREWSPHNGNLRTIDKRGIDPTREAERVVQRVAEQSGCDVRVSRGAVSDAASQRSNAR